MKLYTKDQKIILLNYQDNYVERSNQLKLEHKNFLRYYSLFLRF